jgi:hypothetical protein
MIKMRHFNLNWHKITLFCVMSFVTIFFQQLQAEANYVYHTRDMNDPMPGCNGTPYVSDYTPTTGQLCTLAFKVEYQFYTNTAAIYYTTDGSNPSGAFGVGTGTTQVAMANFECNFNAGQMVDVWKGIIPGQSTCGTVKYIMSAWHSGGGDEIFANGPGSPCNCGTPTNNSSLATVFSYEVTGNQSYIVNERDNVCFGESKGKAAVKPQSPGTYTYNWNTGATTNKISNLAAGTYELTATETTSGCQQTFNFDIGQPATPLQIVSTQYYDYTEFGFQCVQIVGSGGTLPYTFGLVDIEPLQASATTSIVFCLFPGPPPPYQAIIRDANGLGCTVKATVTGGGTALTEEDDNDFYTISNVGPAGELKVSPNPVSNELSMTFEAMDENASGEIMVTNAQGLVLTRRSVAVVKGHNQWNFDVSEYPPGLFTVSLLTNNEQITIPVLKQ